MSKGGGGRKGKRIIFHIPHTAPHHPACHHQEKGLVEFWTAFCNVLEEHSGNVPAWKLSYVAWEMDGFSQKHSKD